MNNFQPKKDSIFYKSAVSVFKIVVLVVLGYLFLAKIVLAENSLQLIIGLFVLIFITLPTIFLMFFKEKFFKKHPKFTKPWKIYRIFYTIFIILYIAIWILAVWHLNEIAKIQKAINFIDSQKITLDDVIGKNLPPVPDQKLNDSTITGIDANKNNIRDDVELAIFKKYPDSAKIRAAELQYAQALQLELIQVFNSETLVPIMQKEDLAYQCLGSVISNKALTAEDALATLDQKDKEVSDLVLNTDLRRKQYSSEYEKYMAGYASLSGSVCNIELSSLPN